MKLRDRPRATASRCRPGRRGSRLLLGAASSRLRPSAPLPLPNRSRRIASAPASAGGGSAALLCCRMLRRADPSRSAARTDFSPCPGRRLSAAPFRRLRVVTMRLPLVAREAASPAGARPRWRHSASAQRLAVVGFGFLALSFADSTYTFTSFACGRAAPCRPALRHVRRHASVLPERRVAAAWLKGRARRRQLALETRLSFASRLAIRWTLDSRTPVLPGHHPLPGHRSFLIVYGPDSAPSHTRRTGHPLSAGSPARWPSAWASRSPSPCSR